MAKRDTFIGLEFPAATRVAFKRRFATNPKSAQVVQRYNIQEYGMTEAEIREGFSDYMEKYGLKEAGQ
jgi:hypothetical protein